MITIEQLAKEYNMSEATIEQHSKRKEFYGIFTVAKMPTVVKKNRKNEYHTVERKRICIPKNKIAEYLSIKEQFTRHKRNPVDWTLSSVECFCNHLDCTKCANWGLICSSLAPKYPEKTPPMKTTVKWLYEKYGKPPQYLIEKIIA